MAKMTRNNLKSLVKECLFEILLESTDDVKTSRMVESRSRRSNTTSKTRRPALDHISVGGEKNKSNTPPRQVDVSHLTEDPIMTAIFQDTAATTLVEQADAERGKVPRGRGDAATQHVAQSDPTQLFGNASQNWAALAFDDK